MSNSVREPFDFEDLTAIYRVERKTPSLSVIRKDLYQAITELLKSLNSEYSKQLSLDPDSLMCEGTNQRRKKAKQLSKEIIEIRMQKICSMALRGAMGAQNVVDQLTSEEKEYYDNVLDLSRKQENILSRLMGEKRYCTPKIDHDAYPVEPPKMEPKKEPADVRDVDIIEEGLSSDEINNQINEPDTEAVEEEEDRLFSDSIPQPLNHVALPKTATEKPQDETEDEVIIRVIDDLPEFSGPERDYKLSKEDIVRMPRIMADALVHRNKAVIIEPSE